LTENTNNLTAKFVCEMKTVLRELVVLPARDCVCLVSGALN